MRRWKRWLKIRRFSEYLLTLENTTEGFVCATISITDRRASSPDGFVDKNDKNNATILPIDCHNVGNRRCRIIDITDWKLPVQSR